MSRKPFTRMEFLRYLFSPPLYVMMVLLVLEALASAATTWLVIRAGRDVANGELLVVSLIWILVVQSASYAVGAISWMFAERAGFRAFSRYMARFARDNTSQTRLLHDRPAREQVEPFLTGETFHSIFKLMYEVESQLKLLLGLIFNAIVLGVEIDGTLPAAYGAVFVILMLIQWSFRKRVAEIYLENQRQNNRVVAHGYTAWDNVFSGNRYNLHLWYDGFKSRLRDCLRAQITAILTREGLSATGAIIGLTIIFITMTMIAIRDVGNTEILIALAATLPRQIEMTNDVHQLATDYNDVLAAWTRIGGVAANMRPEPDPGFDERIRFDRLTLREGEEERDCDTVAGALALVLARSSGRVTIRGGNGSGKSTLLAALKAEIKNRAYYWPTSDRLAFRFTAQLPEPEIDLDADGEVIVKKKRKRPGFSSGERQLRSLQEIVAHTDAAIYLLDEWDANLDAKNRAAADALVQELAGRARVVEISHRDRA